MLSLEVVKLATFLDLVLNTDISLATTISFLFPSGMILYLNSLTLVFGVARFLFLPLELIDTWFEFFLLSAVDLSCFCGWPV